MAEKFAALKRCSDALERLEFFGNDSPKCPHCGAECSIVDNEWWSLYEEGEHEVECPHCEGEFSVSTSVRYSFSTDSQEIDDGATTGEQR